jgi:hypothetical protein
VCLTSIISLIRSFVIPSLLDIPAACLQKSISVALSVLLPFLFQWPYFGTVGYCTVKDGIVDLFLFSFAMFLSQRIPLIRAIAFLLY